MNNTFNINRFGLQLKRQWQEFGKIYLISLLVLAGVLFAFYYFNTPNPDSPRISINDNGFVDMDFRIPLFLLSGLLFITVIASGYFAVMGNKARAIIELMVPSSKLEKFLSGVLFTSFLSILSYLLIFYLVDLGFVSHAQSAFQDAGQAEKFQMFFDSHEEGYTYPFYTLPFAITALFLLGSIYFNRFHYIKTSVSVMLFAGLLSYIFYLAGEVLLEGKVRVVKGNFFNPTPEEAMIYTTIFIGALAIVFWVIGYIRLKEKEV